MNCPLLSIPIHSTPEDRKCVEAACAWWIAGEKSPGSCAIPRLAHYAAGQLKTERELANSIIETGKTIAAALQEVADSK